VACLTNNIIALYWVYVHASHRPWQRRRNQKSTTPEGEDQWNFFSLETEVIQRNFIIKHWLTTCTHVYLSVIWLIIKHKLLYNCVVFDHGNCTFETAVATHSKTPCVIAWWKTLRRMLSSACNSPRFRRLFPNGFLDLIIRGAGRTMWIALKRW